MTQRRLVGVVVLAVVLAGGDGCSRRRQKAPTRVRHSRYGFSIVPPADWSCRGNFAGNLIYGTGPREGDFAVNLTVNVREEDTTAQQALGEVKLALAGLMTDYQPADDGFVTIDGKQAFYLSVKFTFGRLRLQNLQYEVFPGTGRVYTITFTAPEAAFARYRPVFEQAAATARFD